MLLSKNREDLKRDGEKILTKINREQIKFGTKKGPINQLKKDLKKLRMDK